MSTGQSGPKGGVRVQEVHAVTRKVRKILGQSSTKDNGQQPAQPGDDRADPSLSLLPDPLTTGRWSKGSTKAQTDVTEEKDLCFAGILMISFKDGDAAAAAPPPPQVITLLLSE
ncbi:hypothetical protein RUM44_000535 [Polyplax serrata]|uniref:Uncharacterized protein n=1 Tax=Polyplax serrata TaxID=468196 RepID=A0ABR1B5R3_POLSC